MLSTSFFSLEDETRVILQNKLSFTEVDKEVGTASALTVTRLWNWSCSCVRVTQCSTVRGSRHWHWPFSQR